MNRWRLLYRQYPLPAALKLGFSEAVRKLCDPNRMGSYSQFGEDRVIASLLDVNQPGCYVDIGCHHPSRLSNTLHLYQRGWHGLNVDANPRLIEVFQKSRPRDRCVCAAVSNTAGRATLFLGKDPALSTLSKGFVQHYVGMREVEECVEVETRTLQQLFDEYKVPERFQLLCIDVEGHDFEAITSFDLNHYRPYLIVCEVHDLNLMAAGENDVVRYLTGNGYRLRGYAAMNGYFTDERPR